MRKPRIPLYVGHKVGNFQILADLGIRPYGPGTARFWQVRCICGNTREYRSAIIRRRSSCGCLKFEQQMKGWRRPHGKAALTGLMHRYRAGAKKRELVFALTETEFAAITAQDCAYCGQAPANTYDNTGKTNGSYVYNGIDRLDSAIGYICTNCVPCCTGCNRAKWDGSIAEFLTRVKAIYAHMGLALT